MGSELAVVAAAAIVFGGGSIWIGCLWFRNHLHERWLRKEQNSYERQRVTGDRKQEWLQ